MKTKKPRNKKYSLRKSFDLAAKKAIFISFGSESEDGEKVCVCNIASISLRDAVIEHRGDWIAQLAIICQDNEGEYYSKESYIIGKACRINDLTPEYEAERERLLDAINPNHAVDFGWVIRPLSQKRLRNIETGNSKTVLEHWETRQKQFNTRTIEALEALS